MLGFFDENSVKEGWFSPEIQSLGWFDSILLDTVASGSGTIGKTSIGGTQDFYTNGSFFGTKFTAGVTGSVTQLNAYIADAYGGGFNDWSAAIYSVTSGLPNTLLASASGASLSNVLGWQSIPISLSVTSGVEYYLCVWGSVTIECYYDAGATNQSFDRYFVTYNTWDSPFSGTNYNQTSKEYSINVDVTTSGSGYSLTINQGTYTQTGQTLNFLRGRVLTLNQGAYALNGQSINLNKGRFLLLNQGSYSLNGQSINLNKGRILALNNGSYTLTGSAVGLLRQRLLTLTKGDYALTGQGLNFIRARILTLTNGSYNLNGQNITFVYVPVGAYVLVCHQGAFSLVKNSVGLLKGSKLSLAKGDYLTSGQAIDFIVRHYLTMVKGNYSLTGYQANLLKSARLSLSKGDYNLTGEQVELLRQRYLQILKGDYNLTGEDVELFYTYFRKRFFITS